MKENKKYLLFQGFGGGGDGATETRQPLEEDEGVLHPYNEGIVAAGERALSLTEIETLDLISEGEIEGLVTGKYEYFGTLGSIGWDSVKYYPYKEAPNTEIKWLRSIYWNETPVVSSDNKYNFQRVSVSFTNGLPNGSTLDQYNPELTISRTINERLRGSSATESNILNLEEIKDYSKNYTILNKECRGVIVNIKISQLSTQVIDVKKEEFGDIQDATIEYYIYYRPLFGSVQSSPTEFTLATKEIVQGKVSYGYIRSSRIDFVKDDAYYENILGTKDFSGWEIRIIRTTADSTNTTLKNIAYVDSITEIYGDSYVYPNSAIVRQKFSSEFFSQVPERAFDVKLLKVKVPKNYDTITKRYSRTGPGTTNEEWNGEFSDLPVWTDNPAWCYYDLLTNKRYGLGKYIGEDQVDKWSLYQIGKYCDQLVSDGYGGLEPRFTCNLIINSREEAFKVINDMASIFQGISYYANGTIMAVQDSPKSPYLLFTNANVENGDFNYSSTSKKARHTVAVVRYNDKNNFFRPAIEYVEDIDGIKKYGIRELDFTAFGCTSKGQAVRAGKWALLTERMETETIEFNAGFEGSLLQPGDIFKTYDSNKKTKRYAGRIYDIQHLKNSTYPYAVTGEYIILDDLVTLETGNVYKFSLVTPTYNYDPLNTTDLDSSNIGDIRRSHIQTLNFSGFQTGTTFENKATINLYSGFDTSLYSVEKKAVWMIEPNSGDSSYSDFSKYSNIDYDQYRVIRVTESEENRYNVFGIQYAPQKFSEIETGLSFYQGWESRRIYPTAPTGLILGYNDEYNFVDYSFFDDTVKDTTQYNVFIKKDNYDDEVTIPYDYLMATLPYGQKASQYSTPETGYYFFRVYSYNAPTMTYSQDYTSGVVRVFAGEPINEIIIRSLGTSATVDNTNLWASRTAGTTRLTDPEFFWQVGFGKYTKVTDDIKYRITIREQSTSNTPSTNIYYQETGYDFSKKSYVFPYTLNETGCTNGPQRDYDIIVEAHNKDGKTSAGNYVNPLTETWSRSKGYDIYGISNPRMTGVWLSQGATIEDPERNDHYSSIWQTTNIFDQNNEVQFKFNKAMFPSDMKPDNEGHIPGVFVFYCTGDFNRFDVTGDTSRHGTINAGLGALGMVGGTVNGYYMGGHVSSNFPIQTRKQTYPTGYVALGFYDWFDSHRISNWGTDVRLIGSGLTTGAITNTVALTRIQTIGIGEVVSKPGGPIGQQRIDIYAAFDENDPTYLRLYTEEADGTKVVLMTTKQIT